MMYGWTMGLEGWLWMGVWILALFLVVWLLVREPRRSARNDAVEALRSRFARGELTEEEYLKARRLIET